MSIKLTLLKSGEQLISDMKELVAEGQNQPHAYLLDNPHTIDINHKEFITEDEKMVVTLVLMSHYFRGLFYLKTKK